MEIWQIALIYYVSSHPYNTYVSATNTLLFKEFGCLSNYPSDLHEKFLYDVFLPQTIIR